MNKTSDPPALRFDRLLYEPLNGRLPRADAEFGVPPCALAIPGCLIEHPGLLVTEPRRRQQTLVAPRPLPVVR